MNDSKETKTERTVIPCAYNHCANIATCKVEVFVSKRVWSSLDGKVLAEEDGGTHALHTHWFCETHGRKES